MAEISEEELTRLEADQDREIRIGVFLFLIAKICVFAILASLWGLYLFGVLWKK